MNQLLAIQDWAFIASAWALALAGGGLVVWALWWDRARGRKRCPKCWYDMSGATSLVCPECGRDARRERRLVKTRRRWRWAILALLWLLAAYPVRLAPIVRRDGWWAAAPTWVLILEVPDVQEPTVGIVKPPNTRGVAHAIEKRLFVGSWELSRLWWWERALLEQSSLRALHQEELAAQRLGARLLACLRDDAVEVAPEPRRGLVALFATSVAYARADSYVCLAQADTDPGPTCATIAFQRGVGYRWEIIMPPRAQGWPAHLVIWANTDFTKQWSDRDGVSLERAPGNAVGFALQVCPAAPAEPLFLLGAAPPMPRLRLCDLSETAYLGVELLDGVDCYSVRGIHLGLQPVHVWIECKTLSVRRIKTSGAFGSGTTTFRGQFNVPIDDALFDFDPNQPNNTPLMRGELDLPFRQDP